jgi:hypothetical protein
MKRIVAILVPSLLATVPLAARADAYDAFPLEAQAAVATDAPKANLCEHRAVREVAKLDRDLKPVKDLVGIATNPTGFAIRMVDEHVVHIPAWVGIAMDPKGYVRGKVVDRVREEAKRAVGVERDCAAEIAREEA